jgi:hypothetical protein
LSFHTPTSRKEIREMVGARLGKTFATTSQLNDVNREINLAFATIASQAVEAFEASEVTVDLLSHIDLDAYSVGVVLPTLPTPSAIINDRILEFRVAPGGGLLSTLTTPWVPTTDKTWDGRYWLRFTVTSGGTEQVYEIQTREWWVSVVAGQTGNETRYFVSLVNPLPFVIPVGSVQTRVEIFQKYVVMPADVAELGRALYTMDTLNNEVELVSPGTNEHWYTRGSSPLVKGEPRHIARGPKITIESPRFTPSTDLGSSGTWVGDFNRGSFEFCYTFVWGSRTGRVLGEGSRGVTEPLFESPPSAIVARDHNTLGSTGSIILTAENIDVRLGFDHSTLSGSIYRGRSGLRIRWYVRIKSVITASGSLYNNVGASDVFYLLKEIEPTDTVTSTASFTWTGADIPDFERPLFASPGYHGYEVYPITNRPLSLRGRARRVPPALTDDYMVAPMHRDGLQALVNLTCHQMKLNDGDTAGAADYYGRYAMFIEEFRARHGQPGGVIDPATIVSAGRGTVVTFERITVP